MPLFSGKFCFISLRYNYVKLLFIFVWVTWSLDDLIYIPIYRNHDQGYNYVTSSSIIPVSLISL